MPPEADLNRRDTVRQWAVTVGVAIALGIGTWALVRYVPASEGAQVGQRAPDFRLRDLRSGDSVGIRTAFAGHVTLINIWATWCVPCQKEMPSIQRLYDAYRARGFRVAAASIDQDVPAPVLQYAATHALTFDILQDQSTRISEVYQTIGVPESFLIDRQGRIVYVALGAETWDSAEHRRQVEQLLARAE